MKGLILAGGTATRLYPATLAANKQLLPVYDKPMIYYPLSVLMLAGIQEISVITTPGHLSLFKNLLGDGSKWGLRLDYIAQDRPRGVAHALVLGRDFVGSDRVALILGDNLFYGHGLSDDLGEAAGRQNGATIFAHYVSDPNRYGVIKFDNEERAVDIVEKPAETLSHWAVTGLYFYDNTVFDFATALRPSARGEMEITDVNRWYLQSGRLHVKKFGRGYAWLDTGTHDDLLDASEFVRTIQRRQGLLVGCPEEVAFLKGFIGPDRLLALARNYDKSPYGRYLEQLVAKAE
ncbi:MAG: glucose-1-phosphate thymidylyltransferase RfbA [Xanthobacteraceae bacterium]